MKQLVRSFFLLGFLVSLTPPAHADGPVKAWQFPWEPGYCISGCTSNCPCTILPTIIVEG